MGLFDFLFGNRPKEPAREFDTTFKMLNGYVPHFTSFSGGMYESELVRAAINTIATHISKLNVETRGAAKPALQNKLRHGPNEFQSWSQFMARAATIFYCNNTVFITPIWDNYGQISGVYTPLPHRCEVVQYEGKPYLRYEFGWGQKAAIELEYCGVMTRMQYRNDFFGESNAALLPTMDLIHIQNQGIKEGVESTASIKFMAKVGNFTKPDDLKKEANRWSRENFSRDAEASAMLLFPNTYTDIKQIDVKPWVIDDKQMEIIKANVFEYFGVNEDILQNKFSSETWSAFYEGCVEPFALQFSEVMTKMLFTFREQTEGNIVMATSNRLQYMSNADKLQVSAQMADRGLMTRNEIREIWNLPPLPEPYGSQLPVRGEYYNVGDEDDGTDGNTEP